MKIFVTGGLGFIGCELARELVAADHDVTLLDNLSPQIHGALPAAVAPTGAKVVRFDICDIASRHQYLEGVDAVYHLAAETGTGQSMYRMTDYSRVNVGGTSALLEAIGKCTRRPKKVFLASSRSVYGEGAYTFVHEPGALVSAVPRSRQDLEAGRWDPVDAAGRPLTPVPTPEAFPFSPGSVYAATKAAQELLLKSASLSLGIDVTTFRFQNVFGEGQSLQNPYTGIISIFFNRARQGLHIPVFEDGLESRDFVHVSDVAKLLVFALEASLPNGIVLNVGTGIPTSVSSLARTLLRVAAFDVPVHISGQYRVGDIRHCFADLSQTTRYLGFRPTISLEMGLRRFCDWARTQPIYEDQSAQAEEELKERGLTR